jgi:hypothetical protein
VYTGRRTSLGNLPLVVLGSNRPRLAAKLLQAQDAEAALSTNAVDAIALNSTHYIQRPAPRGQPSVVVASVRAVIYAVRAGRRLPISLECSRASRSSAADHALRLTDAAGRF